MKISDVQSTATAYMGMRGNQTAWPTYVCAGSTRTFQSQMTIAVEERFRRMCCRTQVVLRTNSSELRLSRRENNISIA